MIIRAELSGSTTAKACGITICGSSPVLALCRALLAAGYDPSSPLEAYRADTLCLRVRSIGEAARLRVVDGRFQLASRPVSTSPMRQPEKPAPPQPPKPSPPPPPHPTATIGSSLAA